MTSNIYNNENKLSMGTNENSFYLLLKYAMAKSNSFENRLLPNYAMASVNANTENFDHLTNNSLNSFFSHLISVLPGLVSVAVDARLKLPIGPSKSRDGNGRMGTHESRSRDSSGSREPLYERRRGDRLVNANEDERRRGDRQELVPHDEFEIQDVNRLGVSNEFNSRDVNKFNARYEKRDVAFDSYSGDCRPDAS